MAMRFAWALVAAALLTGVGAHAAEGRKDGGDSGPAALSASGSGFDYRYAYRLPGDRVKNVVQANADTCERVGPARCRIVALRYKVDDGETARAMLTISIDPSIARAFGDAVTRSVAAQSGTLVDTEITGTEATAAARNSAVVRRLQEQLANARARNTPEAQAQAAHYQEALDAIAESEGAQGQTLATAPMLFTYESSSALNASDPTFATAGETLRKSAAQLVNVLAGITPWCLLMLVVVLILRWIIHGRSHGPVAGEPIRAEAEAPRAEAQRDNRIQRWFSSADEED
jgi:hypothetical protein